jgi:hypothetical protein
MKLDTASKPNQLKEAYIDMKVLENQSFRLIVRHDNEMLGTISFNRDTDFSGTEMEQMQWITLFDEVDDDVYDGDIGVDDNEGPKVKVAFKIVDMQTPTAQDPL